MEVKEGGGADRVGGVISGEMGSRKMGEEEVVGSGRKMHMVDAMATRVLPWLCF